MKNNQNLSILFWLFRAKATKDGKAPLYARITIDGAEAEISLKRKVHPDFWDVDLKIDTQQNQEAKKTNAKVITTQGELDAHFTVLQTQYETITPQMLKNAYLGKPLFENKKEDTNQVKLPTLLDAFNDYITIFEKKVEADLRDDGTLRHWRTTRGKLLTFLNSKYQLTDMELSNVTYSFAEDFYDFLTLDIDQKLADATAKTHIKKTKQILTGCVNKNFIQNNPLSDFSCGSQNKEVLPHELYELEIIYNKFLPIKRLEEVRDAYIFQCFTGFAFQDTYDLSPENIVLIGSNKERWLIKDRGKTGVTEMVPILPIVEQLIEKYKDHSCRRNKNKLLPINSNYRYNAYLKELADICGLSAQNIEDREFHTHRARHTFAHIMLNAGVPLEDVSRMLGHKSIRTTQRYCKVHKPRISENMKKAKSAIFTKTGKFRKVA
ncbi:site-specific integrase [Sphingobacterium detergens]|uniref:Site-specific recombinase XerD n=1 Tax=Sphingobacterium detergens TaxID=1145106 RepID=A0A420B6X9_SPHD1|nr:site-specific integrase [Sphingobacterium detergens]RKE52467.1 site-specific recombinase XerD [Sphingobacterium detergens]